MKKAMEATLEAIGSANQLAPRLEYAQSLVSHFLPLSASGSQEVTQEQDIYIAAFLKRFEQFEDLMLKRIVRPLVSLLSDEPDQPRTIDSLMLLEKVGAIENADRLVAIVNLRNRLVHEYPMSEKLRTERINAAYASAPTLLNEYSRLEAFVRALEARDKANESKAS